MGVARYQFGNRLRSITKYIDPQKANKTLKQDSISVYAKNFTRSVNKGEDKGKNQEIVSRRGKVRVYNDMDKKIYPRLNWVFLNKVFHVCHYIKIMEKSEGTNKPTSDQPQDTPTAESTLENIMTVPSDPHDFQIQPYQVCN